MPCGISEVIALGSLAASAAGTGLSMADAAARKDAMNKTINDQLAVQQQYQQKNSDLFAKSLADNNVQQAGKDINAGQQQLGDTYRQLQGSLPGVGAANSAIGSDAVTNARTQAQIGQTNDAQAKLQGFQNFNMQQWLRNLNTQGQLGVTNDLSKQRAALTPTLTQLAGQPGALSSIGSLLGTVGNLAGVYGQLKYPTQVGGAAKPPANSGGVPYSELPHYTDSDFQLRY